jgi:hypothetical protein
LRFGGPRFEIANTVFSAPSHVSVYTVSYGTLAYSVYTPLIMVLYM